MLIEIIIIKSTIYNSQLLGVIIMMLSKSVQWEIKDLYLLVEINL